MHPERVKAALRERYGTLANVARPWGRHPSAISAVLRNPRYSIPIERLIAAALGVPPCSIWPDRWATNDVPLPRSASVHSRAVHPLRTSQKREAA